MPQPTIRTAGTRFAPSGLSSYANCVRAIAFSTPRRGRGSRLSRLLRKSGKRLHSPQCALVRLPVEEAVEFSRQDYSVAWESNLRSAGHADARSLGETMLGEFKAKYMQALSDADRDDPDGMARAEVLFASGRA